jgi:hypothetical protein
VPVIGFLSSASRDHDARHLLAFRNGLNETGFAEGRNVVNEHRWVKEAKTTGFRRWRLVGSKGCRNRHRRSGRWGASAKAATTNVLARKPAGWA